MERIGHAVRQTSWVDWEEVLEDHKRSAAWVALQALALEEEQRVEDRTEVLKMALVQAVAFETSHLCTTIALGALHVEEAEAFC